MPWRARPGAGPLKQCFSGLHNTAFLRDAGPQLARLNGLRSSAPLAGAGPRNDCLCGSNLSALLPSRAIARQRTPNGQFLNAIRLWDSGHIGGAFAAFNRVPRSPGLAQRGISRSGRGHTKTAGMAFDALPRPHGGRTKGDRRPNVQCHATKGPVPSSKSPGADHLRRAQYGPVEVCPSRKPSRLPRTNCQSRPLVKCRRYVFYPEHSEQFIPATW